MAVVLAPDVGSVSNVLAQNLGVCTALTSWSNALLNTSLYPLDPKPSWYDALDTQLGAARAAAQQWVDTDGPSVMAHVPQSFIDFGNLFAAAAPDMQSTMTAISAAPGHTATSDQTELLSQSIAALFQLAQQQQTLALAQQATVKGFADKIRSQHDALTTTIAGAEATLTADNSTIADLQSRIASLQNTLGINSTDAANHGQAAMTSAISLFGTLFIFGLTTIATGGAAAPLLGIAVATVAISTNAAKDSSDDKSVQANLVALGQAQSQLTADDAQVAGLRAILGTLQCLIQCNAAVTYAADIIVPIWNDLVARLGLVNEIFQQKSVDFTLASALTSISDAVTSWSSIVTNATNVQESALTMTSAIQLVDQPSS